VSIEIRGQIHGQINFSSKRLREDLSATNC